MNNYDYEINNATVVTAESDRPGEPKKTSGKKRAAKAVSLFLSVAIVGTASGFGGSMLYSELSDSNNLPTTLSQEFTLVNTSDSPETDLDMSVSEIVAKTQPSVVEITTEMVVYEQFNQSLVGSGAGSGVILSEDGYIVTNHHVIEGATAITVKTIDGTEYEAELIGTDAQTDLAVLKIEASGLHAATVGSSEDLTVGDYVLAIGNPLGELGGTVSDGIISSLSREVTIEGETMTLLQTNAAINPGNSGGGLFDENGELIAVVNAKSSGVEIEGIGFAIPIDIAVEVIEDLVDVGYVQGRFKLGVTLIEINDEMTAMMYQVKNTGVYVQSLTQGGNAHISGVMVGDRVVEFNGKAVESTDDVTTELENIEVNQTVEMIVERNGEMQVLNVTLYETELQTEEADRA